MWAPSPTLFVALVTENPCLLLYTPRPLGIRMAVHEKLVVRFGPFEFDTQSGVLSKMGMKLKLQGQPIQILELRRNEPRFQKIIAAMNFPAQK